MSPPASPTASPSPTSKPSPADNLSLDLTSPAPPPLLWPSPPSNTLLITNLNNPSTFQPSSLSQIRTLLSSPTAPLNSFSPLRSLHRIIVSYCSVEAAVAARELLESSPHPLSSSDTNNNNNNDGQKSDDRVKIYYGNPTPIVGQDGDGDGRLLQPPPMGKLLFISPPPSPPCGWEIREEDPPNKETHAEDLQRALAGLGGGGAVGKGKGRRFGNGVVEEEGGEDGGDAGAGGAGVEGQDDDDDDDDDEGKEELDGFGKRRTEGTRKGDARTTRRGKSMTTTTTTTMVYHPRHHGDREDLPAVMVEDTSSGGAAAARGEGLGEGEGSHGDGGGEGKKIMAHTARPPVELMEE